jgi:methyl-accepting chemotaxis protein
MDLCLISGSKNKLLLEIEGEIIKKMKIKITLMQKLLATYAVITLLIGIVGFIGIANSSQNNKTLNKIIDNNLKPMNHIIEAKLQLSYHSRSIYRLFIVKNTVEKTDAVASGKKRIINIENELRAYKENLTESDERKYLESFEESWEKYLVLSRKIYSVINSRNDDETWAIIKNEYIPQFQNVEDSLTEIIKLNQKHIEEDRIYINNEHSKNQIITTIVVIASKIFSLFLGIFLTLSITIPINKLTKISRSISEGKADIEKPVYNQNDEIGLLSKAFSLMIDYYKMKEMYEKQIIELNAALEKNVDEAIEKIRENNKSISEPF